MIPKGHEVGSTIADRCVTNGATWPCSNIVFPSPLLVSCDEVGLSRPILVRMLL